MKSGAGDGSGGGEKVAESQAYKRRVSNRIFLDRLTDPLHLNLFSVPVLVFGSRFEDGWDLVVRQPYAFGALEPSDVAPATGSEPSS